jgi:hypothetical protein
MLQPSEGHQTQQTEAVNLKDRQYNDLNKIDEKTNNDL